MPKKSRALQDLEARIRQVHSENPDGVFRGQVDATDRLLKTDVKNTELAIKLVKKYTGDHPLMLKFQDDARRPGWVPTLRQRTLIFSVAKSGADKGRFHARSRQQYVAGLDDFDPTAATSLDP